MSLVGHLVPILASACLGGIAVWLCYSMIAHKPKRLSRAIGLIVVLVIAAFAMWDSVISYPAFWAEVLRRKGKWEKLAQFKPVTQDNFPLILRAQTNLKRADLLYETLETASTKGWLASWDTVSMCGRLYFSMERDSDRGREMLGLLLEHYPYRRYAIRRIAARWAEDNNSLELMREICRQAGEDYRCGQAPTRMSEALWLALLLARDEQSSLALQVIEDAEDQWGGSSVVDSIANGICQRRPMWGGDRAEASSYLPNEKGQEMIHGKSDGQ